VNVTLFDLGQFAAVIGWLVVFKRGDLHRGLAQVVVFLPKIIVVHLYQKLFALILDAELEPLSPDRLKGGVLDLLFKEFKCCPNSLSPQRKRGNEAYSALDLLVSKVEDDEWIALSV